MDLNDFRLQLGSAGQDLTDAQVAELRDFLMGLGDVIADAFLELQANGDQGRFEPVSAVMDHLDNFGE